MTNPQNTASQPPVVVTDAALRQIERRIKARLRAYFRPGEKIQLAVEDEEDFVCAELSLVLPDESSRLDLEAAVIEQDQDRRFLKETTSRKRLLGAIEFLSEKLENYFRSQRDIRFHVDWRLYPYNGATVRFRGQESRPELEQQASELLEQHEDAPS